MKVLVPRERFVTGLAPYGSLEPVVAALDRPVPPEAAGARAIVSEAAPWSVLRPFFDQVPTLEAIFMTSAGFDHVRERYEGVQIVNARGAHGGSTAEMALAMILAHNKQLPAFGSARRQHDWRYGVSGSMETRRILILGAGDLGRRVRRMAEAMDAEVVSFGRTARAGVLALDQLAAYVGTAYAIVIALPMSAQTARLVDAAFLGAMADGSIIVNVGRGAIVDTDALVAELSTGRIYAGLDVTDPEPLPPDHPLWDAPNLILTPHVGGFAVGAFGRIMRIMGEGMEALARGERPANLVPLSELPPPSRRPQH